MKKAQLLPPDGWPEPARALFSEFEERLTQRVASARNYLRLLCHLFRDQAQAGLGFREFPDSYLDQLLARLTPRNQQAVLATLSHWLRFLYRRGELILPLHQDLARRRVRVRSRRRLLTPDQVLQVLALPDLSTVQGLRDRAFLEVAYATALRRGELVALDLSDVDLAGRRLRVERSKNTYQRDVPLTAWALHFLRRYLAEARPRLCTPRSLNALWLNRLGRRFPGDAMGIRLQQVYRIREQLGFPVTLHQFRHACATHLLHNGAGLRDVQQLLGHVKMDSTQVYTHLTPTWLQEVHRRCHPRNNGQLLLPEDDG